MIDTNVLLDWLLDRDARRTAIVERLFGDARELRIPDVVITELTFVLEKLYQLPRDIVVSNITKVLDEPLFNCNRTMLQRALVEYGQHPSLSFVDCCLMHYASLQRVSVWTFDKKLVNQSSGKALLLK